MKKVVFILLLIVSGLTHAQSNRKSNHQPKRNTAFVELGGIGKAMYSINYDRVLVYSKPFHLAMKAGMMFPSVDSEDEFRKEYTYPVELLVRTADEGFLEFGIGQVFTLNEDVPTNEAPPYLRCGFRTLNEDGGIMFRLSLVSNLLHQEFKPRLHLPWGTHFN